MRPTPIVDRFSGPAPAFSDEQTELLRAVDRLRGRLRRTPRMTDVLDLLRCLGYRRLPPALIEAYDHGLLDALLTPPAALYQSRGTHADDATE